MLNLPNQPNPNPIQSVIERGNLWRRKQADSSQTRSVHESETFNVGDKTLRKERRHPLLHDDLSHEKIMLNQVNLDFRIPGLPHSVVKHA